MPGKSYPRSRFKNGLNVFLFIFKRSYVLKGVMDIKKIVIVSKDLLLGVESRVYCQNMAFYDLVTCGVACGVACGRGLWMWSAGVVCGRGDVVVRARPRVLVRPCDRMDAFTLVR